MANCDLCKKYTKADMLEQLRPMYASLNIVDICPEGSDAISKAKEKFISEVTDKVRTYIITLLR